ncbi:hypothetical protein AAC387_Pa01g2569 [Persea americana]
MMTSGAGDASYLFHSNGLAYAVVFAVVFLVLLSSSLLAYFFFCHHRFNHRNSSNLSSSSSGIIAPRVFFIPQIHDPDDLPGPGLHQSVINSYPRFPFRSRAAGDGGGGGGGGGEVEGESSLCSICLYHYREGEALRMLPDCRHSFHLRCVDTWLRLNPTCPICRTSPLPTPVPTPLPTPLSELVPLSHYPAERSSR